MKDIVQDGGDGIGAVLDVIRGIAEQTNLLALNAATEAARAGESVSHTEQLAEASQQLQQSSNNMSDIVTRFKLD